MIPTEALQVILTKIRDNDSSETLADLAGDIEEIAEGALDLQPISLGGTKFDFPQFETSRRGVDIVLKGAILAAGGQVRLSELNLARYAAGYDLHIQKASDGIILTAPVRF